MSKNMKIVESKKEPVGIWAWAESGTPDRKYKHGRFTILVEDDFAATVIKTYADGVVIDLGRISKWRHQVMFERVTSKRRKTRAIALLDFFAGQAERWGRTAKYAKKQKKIFGAAVHEVKI
jgi:hypothetical protein